MKKILAMMLTAAMMLSMGTAVWADDVIHTGVDIEYHSATVKAENNEERVSFDFDLGSIEMKNYSFAIWHVEYPDGATDTDGDTEKEGATYEVQLATIFPMDEAINQSSSLMTGEHSFKFIVGDGESDNWYQVNNTAAFTDAEYPNLVIFSGTDVEDNEYFICYYFEDLAPQTTGEGENAVTTSDWIEFNSTIENAMYPGQDSGVKHFNKVYKVDAGEETPEETFKFDFDFVKYVDADENTYTFTAENDGDEFNGTATATVDNETKTVNGIPVPSQATIKFNSLTATWTDAVPVSLNADDFPAVGVYTYKVTEVDNNIAGVTYSTTPIYLVVTILRSSENDDLDNTDDAAKYIAAIHYSEAIDSNDKIGEVVNSYDSDSLAITKQVEGNLADTTEYFKVTVKFTAPTGDDKVVDLVKSPIYYTAAKDAEDKAKYDEKASVAIAAIADAAAGWSEETVEIWLKDGDTITFTNIPVGVTYEVVEEKPTDYEKVTYSGTDTQENNEKGSGEIDTADTVLITNYKDADIDTGISVDSIPYIAMLGVVAIGGTGFIVSKKRRSED